MTSQLPFSIAIVAAVGTMATLVAAIHSEDLPNNGKGRFVGRNGYQHAIDSRADIVILTTATSSTHPAKATRIATIGILVHNDYTHVPSAAILDGVSL
jgi:hypothetical protein